MQVERKLDIVCFRRYDFKCRMLKLCNQSSRCSCLSSRATHTIKAVAIFLFVLLCPGAPMLPQAMAQGIPSVPSAPVIPSLYPTDVTRIPIGQEQELLHPGPSYYLFQKLPPRLWFNLSVEESQRYESNVFFTQKNHSSDYVFRSLPNITVGYNVLKHTSIYSNYFVIKDVFANHSQLSFPTTQSTSLGLRHEFTNVGQRNSLQFDFQARELFQTVGLRQADLIPGLTFTRAFTPRTIGFVNVLLQMRGRNYFVAPTREIDPFYTVGVLHSRGLWVFTAVGTLVTNFRHPPFNDSIPTNSNNAIILDFEVSHPINKRFPNLVAFTRAEPIFNWGSHGEPGISGYDFRIFGGVRFTLVKPNYGSSMDKLRKQLQNANAMPNQSPFGPSGSPANSGSSPGTNSDPGPSQGPSQGTNPGASQGTNLDPNSGGGPAPTIVPLRP
jgi:hypothetical protein